MRHFVLAALAAVLTAGTGRADGPPVYEFTGRTEPTAALEVRSRVSGYLTKVAVSEGAEVKAGDLLIEIDPRPYETELSAAKAQLAKAEALAKRAAAELARAKAAFEKGTETETALRDAQARADANRAEVELATAGIKAAELKLGWTRVRAPWSGRVSRVALDEGNLVVADTTPVMTVVSIDKLYVTFEVDETCLPKIQRELTGAKGAGPAVAVGFLFDDGYPHAARIDFIAPEIDPKTGTARVRATLPNPKGEFRPGAFVRVRVRLTAPGK